MPLRIAFVAALVGVGGVAAQEEPARMALTVDKGRVTCTIRNYPLHQVIDGLGERTGVTLIAAEDLADDRVSLEAVSVPLDEALRRLLARYDTFFYYSGSDSAPAPVRGVWIYRKGSAVALRPIPPESWASTAELRRQLEDSDSAVREQAYVALMSRNDAESRERVWNALRGATETDEGMRQRLLTAAAQQGISLPRDLLVDIARADGSETLRLLALDALVNDPGVTDIAAFLARDPSSTVRRRAKEILAEWETLADRRKPPR